MAVLLLDDYGGGGGGQVLGPSGCGKTHLIRTLAQLIGVPFVKADATKFSATGQEVPTDSAVVMLGCRGTT